MRIRRAAHVYRSLHKSSAANARIYRGAVLRMRMRGPSPSCQKGWFEREGRGFICGKYLKRTDITEARPSYLDAPDILFGLDAMRVTRNGPRLYRRLKDIARHHPNTKLLKDSYLIVKRKLLLGEKGYYETRRGWYVEDKHLEKLPPAIQTLGVNATEGQPHPSAIVTSPNVEVFDAPQGKGKLLRKLERWVTVPGLRDEPLLVEQGWVKLPEGGYVSDDHISRIRPAPRPPRLKPDERWIAVDIKEQLFHAYEGEQLIRVIPCSTGIRGNTKPGMYRIQWKRRMQTMRLRHGRLRVEDVQWVMYYHRRNDIAIHSAYWHHNFGKPVSHGCVNLPPGDARWVFEWSTPRLRPEDSERFQGPRNPGSRVIVFKNGN